MNELVIDESFIERLVSLGGPKLRNDLIAMFLERTPEKLAQIEAGMASGDFNMIEQAAHSLISSAGNLGGSGVSRSAARVEAAAMGQDADSVRSEVVELKRLQLGFKAYLESILEES